MLTKRVSAFSLTKSSGAITTLSLDGVDLLGKGTAYLGPFT